MSSVLFTQKELTITQRRLLELLKNYDTSIHIPLEGCLWLPHTLRNIRNDYRRMCEDLPLGSSLNGFHKKRKGDDERVRS